MKELWEITEAVENLVSFRLLKMSNMKLPTLEQTLAVVKKVLDEVSAEIGAEVTLDPLTLPEEAAQRLDGTFKLDTLRLKVKVPLPVPINFVMLNVTLEEKKNG